MESVLEVPILFLIFNRPETTQLVFDEIKKQRPKFLYVAADGPRDNKLGEKEKCEITREIINQIDWPCELKTLYREKNLGCGKAVSSAITWFFENVEKGIVIEDDCMPSHSFFKYCDELLVKYKQDMRIWHISGAAIHEYPESQYSYHFSNYPGVWGWASWANRWKHYDVELEQVKDESFIRNVLSTTSSIKFWSQTFHKMKNRQIDTWDFQWVFATWIGKGLSITPSINQISNIGFGAGATHTVDPESALSRLKAKEIGVLRHPHQISISYEKDNKLAEKFFSVPSLSTRLLRKITRRVL